MCKYICPDNLPRPSKSRHHCPIVSVGNRITKGNFQDEIGTFHLIKIPYKDLSVITTFSLCSQRYFPPLYINNFDNVYAFGKIPILPQRCFMYALWENTWRSCTLILADLDECTVMDIISIRFTPANSWHLLQNICLALDYIWGVVPFRPSYGLLPSWLNPQQSNYISASASLFISSCHNVSPFVSSKSFVPAKLCGASIP